MTDRLHPDDAMSSRERLLAAYRGDETDHIPCWFKVTNNTWRTSQPEEIRALSPRELLDFIGADGLFHTPRPVRVERPHVQVETTRRDDERITVTHTPDGDLVERNSLDPFTQSWHPVEFPIKSAEDIARYRWLWTDIRVSPDEELLGAARAAVRDVGERGITLHAWGTSPWMFLVEHGIGPVNAHLLQADNPDELDELIALMHAGSLEIVRTAARCTPADAIVSVENTSTTLISPRQFERYCLPHLKAYGRAITEAGKMHELHMCGHTNVLLPEIDAIPASSIEAFTAPPLGNTRLVDGRTKAPSKTLVGGTNAMLWLRPLDEIKQFIRDELLACPDRRRIVVTTAGVAPPACPAETFRAIAAWIAAESRNLN